VAPADAAAAPPIEPYFGANGEATARATSLPPLPGFETFRAANSATAPPLLSLAGQSTARAANSSATAPPLLSSAVQSTAHGRSGSVLSFLTTTQSTRRTTNTATTPSSIRKNELLTSSSITTEGEEEGGGGEAIDLCGEEGEEVCLPTISTVWECAYINYKDVNGKEGWECQWYGLSFKPRHASRAMRHVLKLKKGVRRHSYLQRPLLLRGTETDTRPYMIGNSQGLIVRENRTRLLGTL